MSLLLAALGPQLVGAVANRSSRTLAYSHRNAVTFAGLSADHIKMTIATKLVGCSGDSHSHNDFLARTSGDFSLLKAA
jgi:hypothetical protein